MTKISIVIPTFNEIDVIDDCIASLGFQSRTDFEIIAVDDGSTDGTLTILNNLATTLPNFKVFKENHLGAGAARNLGVKNADGKILVFVDADMTFDKDFIKDLVAPIEQGQIKGTFSKNEMVGNWGNIWSQCWNLQEGWEAKRRHPKNYPDSQPVFRAILKSEFEKVGGFTPGGYDDDWSLSKKLGYMAIGVPGAIFYHKNPETLWEIYNHAKWVGKRKYKFGGFGYLAALVRASLPISLAVGLYKSFRSSLPAFILFKIVYDIGIFIGILEFLLSRKSSK